MFSMKDKDPFVPIGRLLLHFDMLFAFYNRWPYMVHPGVPDLCC